MLKYISFILIILSLSSCSVSSDYSPPRNNIPKTAILKLVPKSLVAAQTKRKAQYVSYSKHISAAWWEAFKSYEINALIAEGFLYNPSIAKAQTTLKQAQEEVLAEIGRGQYPQVDALLGAKRERNSLLAVGIAAEPDQDFPFRQSNVFNTFSALVGVSYKLDIFGKNRRKIEALLASFDHELYELKATYLTLTTNIVTRAIAIASLNEQIKVTQNLAKIQRNIINITAQNIYLGHDVENSLTTQKLQLKDIVVTLPQLKNQLAKEKHNLSILIGKLPTQNILRHLTLNNLHLPLELPMSLPSRFVKQRPDIESAEALLHKASAEVGVATADLYPDIVLSANYGWVGSILSSLFSHTNTIWSYGGQLSQAIFHGGELMAKRRAAISFYQQTLSNYQEVILDAFKQVANVLQALKYDAEILKIRHDFESITREQYRATSKFYRLGKESYLKVLDLQLKIEQAKLNRVKAQAEQYADSAELFNALGGGLVIPKAKQVRKYGC